MSLGDTTGTNFGNQTQSQAAQRAAIQAQNAALYSSALGNVASTFSTVSNAITSEKQRRSQAKASAGSYRQQSALYSQQAQQYLMAASLSASNAKVNAEIGEMNARNSRYRASFIQIYEDSNFASSRKRRLAKIGAGRAEFAANGILLESRAGSASSIWEQDEEADAAIERINIMQQAEDEAYGYFENARNALVSGYSNAASSAADAASQAANAASSALQAQYAMSNAIAAERAARKRRNGGLIGALVGGVAAVGGLALAPFTGGLSMAAAAAVYTGGAAAGAAIGSSIGTAIE